MSNYYGPYTRQGGAIQPIDYAISQVAASDGTATFKCDAVALSNTWTVTVNCATAEDTARFTAATGASIFGQFKGSNSWGPMQLLGGDQLVVTATGLVPGTNYVLSVYGSCYTVNEPGIVYPQPYADTVTTSTEQIYLGKVVGDINQKTFSINNIQLQPTWRSLWVAAVQLTPYTGTTFTAFASGQQSGFKYAGNKVPYTASLNSFLIRIPLVSGMDTNVNISAVLNTGQVNTQLTVYYGADLTNVDSAVYPEGEFDVTVANTTSNPVNVNIVSGGGGGGGNVTVVNTTAQPVPIQGVQGSGGTAVSITPGDASATPLYVQIVGGSISYVPMGGDVTGNSNAATVVGIEGKLIATPPTAAGQILVYNGSTWNSTNSTGSSNIVFSTSPTITTATLSGNTTAGTINNTTIPSSSTLVTTSTISSLSVTTFSAGTTGLTPSTATNGAITLGGTLSVANGGLGANYSNTPNSLIGTNALGTGYTVTATGNALGQTIASNGSGWGTVNAGANGTFLKSDTGAPYGVSWQSPTGSGNVVLQLNSTINAPFETTLISATALNSSNAATIALGTQAVYYYTANPTSTWPLNITGAPTTPGQSATLAILVNNGATAYLPSNITVNTIQAGPSTSSLPNQGATNNNITSYYQGGIKWANADISTLDVYTITVICTAASTWTLLLGLTEF